MALINCPECGKEISSSAAACPNCGYPIQDFLSNTQAANVIDTGSIISVENSMETVFLGKKYSFPLEIKQYLEIVRWYEPYYAQMLDLMYKQIKKKEYSGGADEDFAYFKNPLSKIVDAVIGKLSEYGVYNITSADLLDNNAGYRELRKVCTAAIEEEKRLLLEQISSFMDSMDEAEYSAKSHITGSGVSIWTSSLASALWYNFLETGVINQQEKEARKIYSGILEDASRRGASKQEQGHARMLVEQYYPGVKKALDMFSEELFGKIIRSLESAGKLDYSKISGYDINRSSDILNNLSNVNDKKPLLQQAYALCPYNMKVFSESINIGLFDKDMIDAAKEFDIDSEVKNQIASYCNAHKKEIVSSPEKIAAYAYIIDKDSIEVKKELFKSEIAGFKNKFDAYSQVASDRKRLVDWICQNMTDSSQKLYSMQDSEIKQKVDAFSNTSISDYTVKTLISDGTLTLVDVLPGAVLDYDGCLQSLSDSITNAVIAYKATLPDKLEKIESTYTSKKNEIERKLSQAKDVHSKILSNISDMEKELANAGMFELKKKKELKIAIDETRNKMEGATSDVNKLEAELKAIENEKNAADRITI